MNQDLIDKHREINVNDDWWHEGIYEWFEEQCHERGVNILSTQRQSYVDGQKRMEKDITWSGFWSQGDGAAFSGSVVNLEKALGDFYSDYPILRKYVDELNGFFKFTWRVGRGNYIIINDLEVEPINLYLDEDHPFEDVWKEQLDEELERLEPVLTDLAEELCDLLYKALRDEYEAMTSDEAVWDTIVANELDKEEEDGQV
jgi:hypothetical protein